MTEQLTGYEASSVAEIEAILDAMPADSDTVYLDTIAYSERAIAAVAAKRAGGGSAPVTTRGRYDTPGLGVSIANGGVDYVPWHLESGDALLDLTDPQFPTVLESGIYAVSVSAIPYDSMTADGFFTSVLILDRGDRDAESAVDSRLATDAQLAPEAHAALTYYVPAGNQIAVRVRNRDGTNTIRFDFDFANVQRIT